MPQIDCGTVDFTAIDDPVELDHHLRRRSPVAPVQEGLQLLRSPEATVDADLRTAVHEAAERLVHHNFVEGHGRERRRDALTKSTPFS